MLTVARPGPVSAVAEAIRLHRATVHRHVETLEGAFGAPLFRRYALRYALTDTGLEMLEVDGGRADEMFADLAGRSRGKPRQLSGSLVETALAGVIPTVMPAIRLFRLARPRIALHFVAGAQTGSV